MKSLAALAAALLFTALTGCGEENANMSAQYPAPPGADAPEQFAAAAEPPNVAAPPQVQGQMQGPGGEAPEAAAYAQPAAGDIQVGSDPNEYADTDPAALQDFKPALDPYGSWVEDPQYGTVWTPSPTVVGNDFAPYVTGGHWAYDNDYVWVSDYDWGWAPFHYGRWVYATNRWGWIPGRTYAGAWVTWRSGYDDWGYVGWAPMPPTWYWRGGYAVGLGYVPMAPYAFCHGSHVFEPGGLRGHIVAGPQVAVVASHTRPYVPANPSVGGHSAAHPTVGGPPPRSYGVTNPPSAGANRGLAQAQQFAKPQTATAVGAHAPQQYAARSASTSNAANAGAQRGFTGSNPAVSGGQAQRFGTAPTTLGQGGQHSAVATSPQYRGVSPTPHPMPYSGPSRSSSGMPQHFSGGAGGSSGGSYSAPHYSSPSYSAPHYSSPSYSSPSAGGGFHSSTPTYHQTVPSYHSSAPATHSSGGGGFRGGASRGGGRR